MGPLRCWVLLDKHTYHVSVHDGSMLRCALDVMCCCCAVPGGVLMRLLGLAWPESSIQWLSRFVSYVQHIDSTQ